MKDQHGETMKIVLLPAADAPYDEDGKKTDSLDNVKLDAAELTSVPAMVGKELPAALLLNSDDWGFGYFEMDDLTVKVFE